MPKTLKIDYTFIRYGSGMGELKKKMGHGRTGNPKITGAQKVKSRGWEVRE